MKVFKIQKHKEIEAENNTENLTDKSHEGNNQNFRICFHIEKVKRSKKTQAKVKGAKGGVSKENCAKSSQTVDIEEYFQILVKKLEQKYSSVVSKAGSTSLFDNLANIHLSSENKLSLVCKLLRGTATGQTSIVYPKCVRPEGKHDE